MNPKLERALAEVPSRALHWVSHSWDRDRIVRAALEWLNQRGCIVQRTPPVRLIYLSRRPGKDSPIKLIARRFTTKGMPQITGMLPGGRFLAVMVRNKLMQPSKLQMDWLRSCARLGGAAMVVRDMEELQRAFEHVSEQRPDPWINTTEVEWVPPPARPGSPALFQRKPPPAKGRWVGCSTAGRWAKAKAKKGSGPGAQPCGGEPGPSASPLEERRRGEG